MKTKNRFSNEMIYYGFQICHYINTILRIGEESHELLKLRIRGGGLYIVHTF